jgi:uncharacterized protein
MTKALARVSTALALVVVLASCGSSGGSRLNTSPALGHELDPLPSVLKITAEKLPPAPTNARVEPAYLITVFDDVQALWRRDFADAHEAYRPARVVVFYSITQSACGRAKDSGPFYCPGDDTVYLDLRFFSLLLGDERVGAAAQAYIIGHELGHHIQRLAGIATDVETLDHKDPSHQKARGVLVELQADCLAGVWGRSVYPRSPFERNDLFDALKTAHVIGDDYIQEAAGHVVDSSLFTHGSSQQRRSWLQTGYKSGKPGACDTFLTR